MISYKKDGGHVEFTFRVVGPNAISFHLKDRYSAMRQFQSTVKKELINQNIFINKITNFPKKKIINSQDDKFLQNRMEQIGRFFNDFLKIPEVA
jgi:hypothetical protein